MSFRCEKCKDGGDITPMLDEKYDMILHCDSCGWWRYPTEDEHKQILGVENHGM